MVSGAKSGANFSLKACCNLVKRVEVVILLPRQFSPYLFIRTTFVVLCNPSNQSGLFNVEFSVAELQDIAIRVYNMIGEEISSVLNETHIENYETKLI